MGKECMARLSRRLWRGKSLKTAAEEARFGYATWRVSLNSFTMKSFESFDNAIPLYRVLSTDE